MFKFLSNIINIPEEKIREFFKFALVGGSGVVVNMGLLYVFRKVFSLQIEIASPIAIEISILTNFLLNNIWTFRQRDTRYTVWNRLLRYHLVTGIAGLVNYLILLLLVKAFGLNEFLSNLIGIGFGMLINYFLNSKWTWKERSY